jgi:histidinol phosphatase-like PHP family hydrolase
MAAGVPIAVNSDAHFASQVGRFEAALAMAEQIGLAEERIVNRTPASVLEHLLARRERPRLDHGGVWDSGQSGVA